MGRNKNKDTLKVRFSNIPNELDIVNIGSGPSYYAFDWSDVPGISGYNLAIAPEDFRYDARIIKNYGYHVKKGGVVVVAVVPLSFGENEYQNKSSFSEKYASILPSEDVDLPKWRYFLVRNFPLAVKVKNKLFRIISKIFCRDKKKPGNLPQKDRMHSLIAGWISENRYLHDLKDGEQAENYRETFQRRRGELKEIIDNCRRQGLKPVLLLPPLSSKLREQISDTFIEKFVYDNVHSVLDGDVLILDYIDDPRFKSESYYTNGLFLTQPICRKFTKIVWEDINNLLR